MPTPADPAAALPLTLDLEDFKVGFPFFLRFGCLLRDAVSSSPCGTAAQGDFSFDALFGGLVDELLPEYRGEDDAAPAPPPPPPVLGAAPPVFPAVDELLGLFKHSCKELVDLRRQVRHVPSLLALNAGCELHATPSSCIAQLIGCLVGPWSAIVLHATDSAMCCVFLFSRLISGSRILRRRWPCRMPSIARRLGRLVTMLAGFVFVTDYRRDIVLGT